MKATTEAAFWYWAARAAAMLRPRRRAVRPWPPCQAEPGISVVIPSRSGRDLLAAQLPGIARELAGLPSEIIVADNGSDDGTGAWLEAAWPLVRVAASAGPLSFASAVNRGIERARFSRVCLLNNDMLLEPGFFAALETAFERVPGLFCATAQIFFPEGARREETGKAVWAQARPEDFPIRCDEPLPSEDLTWVLYGSGGCSLYDAARLRELGGIDEAYAPAYVEDLDIGYRAWLRGWPSVYVSGARLLHRHRATSSRYYSESQLEEILERNYLKFLARAVAGQRVFTRLWRQALDRLKGNAARRAVLRAAWRIALEGGAPEGPACDEERLLALCAGGVAVVPGGSPPGKPVMVLAGLPKEAPPAGAIMVVPVDRLEEPDPYLLARCAEIVLVTRSAGPAAFGEALRQTVRKWRPDVVRESPLG